jgi:hypothetical protein
MLPEGEYLYKDLSSDFVDVDKLLDEVGEEGVSGYLSFESDDSDERGFAELSLGEPGRLKVMRNGKEHTDEGQEGLEKVLKKGSYTVQVVECDESGQEIVSIKLENEEIKSDISTEDIDVPNFLSTNITDQKNDCHLLLISEEHSGVVTMVDGIPEEAKISTPKEIFVGNEALNKALEYIDDGEVTVDVYEMTEEEVEEKQEAESAIGERMKGELEGISEEFEEKADELLDDMGLDFMAEEDEEGDGGLVEGDGGKDDVFGGIESEEG